MIVFSVNEWNHGECLSSIWTAIDRLLPYAQQPLEENRKLSSLFSILVLLILPDYSENTTAALEATTTAAAEHQQLLLRRPCSSHGHYRQPVSSFQGSTLGKQIHMEFHDPTTTLTKHGCRIRSSVTQQEAVVVAIWEFWFDHMECLWLDSQLELWWVTCTGEAAVLQQRTTVVNLTVETVIPKWQK